MSWLARIQIDYATATRHKLRDIYAWHQAMWRAFPRRDGEEREFLFRVDARDVGPEALILSRVEPARPDWCPDEEWSVRQIKPEVLGHRYYRFDLRANATRKVTKLTGSGEPSKNGRRAVISGEQELRAWLDRKATQGGFRVVDDSPLVIDPRTEAFPPFLHRIHIRVSRAVQVRRGIASELRPLWERAKDVRALLPEADFARWSLATKDLLDALDEETSR